MAGSVDIRRKSIAFIQESGEGGNLFVVFLIILLALTVISLLLYSIF